MLVYKRKYRSGKVVWYYQFAPAGSTRENQNLVTERLRNEAGSDSRRDGAPH
jgi:hypothetical protein